MIASSLDTLWNSLISSRCVEDMLISRGYSDDHPFYRTPPDFKYLSCIEGELSVLDGRWVTPIRYPDGRVCTLVGWNPKSDSKYLTLPVDEFSKKHLLFGLDLALRTSTSYVYVVEGIFDCLALNSIGIPSVSVMGSSISSYQLAQLGMYPKGRVVGVPDRDICGRVVSGNVWKLSRYLTWSVSYPCKDMDDMVELVGEDLREPLRTIALDDTMGYLVKL